MNTELHKILARREGISPHTRKACQRAIDRFVEFASGNPNNWTLATGQAFYDHLRASGMRNGARTVMGHLRYVSMWHARRNGGEDFAVVQMATKEPRAARNALSVDEARALLATCEDWDAERFPSNRRDWTMLVVGFETGMRTMSISGMEWDRLGRHRLGYPRINVPIKGAGGTLRYDVPLSDTAMLALDRWRAASKPSQRGHGFVFTGLERRVDNKGRLIQASKTLPIAASTIYLALKTRAERASIRHVHPHLLRHTFISWRGAARVPFHWIAAVTGHTVEYPMERAATWGELPTYLDETIVANDARNTTPQWLAQLVRERCG